LIRISNVAPHLSKTCKSRRTLIVILALLTFPVIGQPSGPSKIALVEIVRNLPAPLALASPADGSGRLFVALGDGRIVIISGGYLRAESFLDIRTRVVDCCFNGGLLSLVFHPAYSSNGFFFVQYVNKENDTVVARYSVSQMNRETADPGSERILFVVDQPADDMPNHHGGDLHFGPDGYLYSSIGDGGVNNGVKNRAQELSHFMGKILRIDVDQGMPYSIPPDNPFISIPGARREIWSYGLRNPWRFSFDVTGRLFLADVGNRDWEEINSNTISETRGANYGWPRMEGLHCFDPPAGCDDGTLLKPRIEYSTHDDGSCSVTGGYRYRGNQLLSQRGVYFYGDFCSGKIWGASERAGGSWESELLLDTSQAIVSFGEDEAGELYVIDYYGTISRIVEPARPRTRPVRR